MPDFVPFMIGAWVPVPFIVIWYQYKGSNILENWPLIIWLTSVTTLGIASMFWGVK